MNTATNTTTAPQAVTMAPDGALGDPVSRSVMALRLAAGLAQGGLLYCLYRAHQDGAWPATSALLAVPLMMLGLIMPVLLISSLGHMSRRQVRAWMLAAAVPLLAMALHDAWRGGGESLLASPGRHAVHAPSALLTVFGCGFFFIAHALVLAGVRQRRRLASYDAYFETAWKLGIQLMFSALFVGALWLALLMGSELFMLIKLDFLRELIHHAWFGVPVSCFAFSCAMHITDVRPAIVRGIRTLLLVLLSWLLPVTALIVAGFLCSLPYTSLAALWGTRHATAVLLTATAMLVMLINAAFQGGEAPSPVAALVRGCARVAAVLPAPLSAIGAYALALRVGEYGWTSDRVIAAACLLVAGCYAAGYAWAALSRGAWLQPVARVNVWTAFVVLAVLLALFTPLADPARLSVDSQLARLAAGRIAAEKFDFHYLRFDGARYGKAALERLAAQPDGPAGAPQTARLARQALALTDLQRWNPRAIAVAPASVADNLTVWPPGASLPAGFAGTDWRAENDVRTGGQVPNCLVRNDARCDAIVFDATGDGQPDVLLLDTRNQSQARLMARRDDGSWHPLASLALYDQRCAPLLARLKQGDYALAAPPVRDLLIGGRRLHFEVDMARGELCGGLTPAAADTPPAAR